jgi:small GTP-binding protein
LSSFAGQDERHPAPEGALTVFTAPKGLRLHIGIYGRRNAGKSSLLNALVGQQTAIVSDIPGTTTDPVEKTLEFLPIGPVVFIDTAGIDDTGALGELRTERTMRAFDRTDVAMIVTETDFWGEYEDKISKILTDRQTPFFAALNKADLAPALPEVVERLQAQGISYATVSAATGEGLAEVRAQIVQLTPEDWFAEPRLLGGSAAGRRARRPGGAHRFESAQGPHHPAPDHGHPGHSG